MSGYLIFIGLLMISYSIDKGVDRIVSALEDQEFRNGEYRA